MLQPASARARRLKLPRGVSPFRLAAGLIIGFVALLVAYPFLRIVLGLFIQDGVPTIDPIRKAVTTGGLGELLWNSTRIVFVAGVLALTVGSLLAWLNERTNARVPLLTDVVPLMPFILPSIATAIGWTFLLSPGAGFLNAALREVFSWFGVSMQQGPLNIFSIWGMIFLYFIVLVPYVFLFVSAGLRNLPSDIEEQSRINGAGVWRTLRKITIPALKPNLAAAGMIVVWFGFAMFSIPLIIGTGANIDVLTVRIVRLINFTYPPDIETAIGLSFFILLIVGGAWLVQVRIMSKGLFAQVGGRGSRKTQIDLGWRKWPARLAMVAFLLISGILPVLALIITALEGFWQTPIPWGDLSLQSFSQVLQDPVNIRAIRNSLLLGLIAGTGIVLFSALMSVYMRKGGGWLNRAMEVAIRAPVVLSGFVLLVGMILAYSGAPFFLQGTLLLFVIAYMATSIPQASIVADAAAAQVSNDMSEASTLFGAGEAKTFFRIQLPLMMPGLIAGWTLVVVHITGDMEVASMLASSQQPVVGYQILNLYNIGNFGQLAAVALVLTALSIGCVVAGSLVGNRLAGRVHPKRNRKDKTSLAMKETQNV